MSDSRLMNHKLHLVISIFTLGSWLPIYAVLFIIFKVEGSTIESRKAKKKLAKEAQHITRNLVQESRSKGFTYKKSLGYKKGNFVGGQTYSLECTHQIRARKQTGIVSRGMIGKTVWCDVCKSDRVVTGSILYQN